MNFQKKGGKYNKQSFAYYIMLVAIVEYKKLRELLNRNLELLEVDDVDGSDSLTLSFGTNREFILHDIGIDMSTRHIEMRTNDKHTVIFEFDDDNSLKRMTIRD